MASLLVGGALAVALLGLAWGLPDALHPRFQDPLEPSIWLSPPQRGTAVAMSTLMLAPVIMLLIATGRLSAVVRDQRLISLRLIGVSKTRLLVTAVAENISITLIGVAVGLLLLRFGATVVDAQLPVVQPFHLAVWQWVVVAVGVIATSGLLALASAQNLELLPTQARRGGIAKEVSWWRILPVVTSLGCFGALIASAGPPAVREGLFFSGVLTGALAIATTPALVARYSAVLLRSSRRLTLVMAGRGIQADPTSATRRVGAVGIGVFAVVITAAVMNSWESVAWLRYATHNAERGPQEVAVQSWNPNGDAVTITEADIAAFAALGQVDQVVRDYGLAVTGCADDHWAGCPQAFVGTCAQLSVYLPAAGCSDVHAAWIDNTGKWPGRLDDRARPATVELRSQTSDTAGAGPATEPLTVHVSGPAIGVDWRLVEESRGFTPQFDVFVPERFVTGLDLPIRSLDVIGPPGRDFAASVALAAQDRGLQAPLMNYLDYDVLLSVRALLGGAGAALVAVVILVVTLSILDWLRESRRPRQRLFAAGVPRGAIARTYLVQFGIPLAGAMALGGVLGGAGLLAYEAMADVATIGAFNLPPTYWWLLSVLVAGVLVAVGLAGLAARERMLPSDLRTE